MTSDIARSDSSLPAGSPSPDVPVASLEHAYDALHHGAVLVNRSTRSRTRFAGPKAAESLTGLVTNDVLSLKPGDGQYAASLTAKGKVIADVRIFMRAEDVLVDVGEQAAPGWWATIRKYVNPRLATYADVTGDSCDIGVFGPLAHEVVARAIRVDKSAMESLSAYGHIGATYGEDRITIARVPDLGVQGFEIFAPRVQEAPLMRALGECGALPAPPDLVSLAHIEAGRPQWGVDMDEGTLAQEANLEELGAISFTKGCYTGQETVARVHFRGHVNRHLRGLRIEGAALPPRATELVDSEERPVGDVRSAARSPRFGGIALAMVRREIASGARLSARWSSGEATAVLSELPFTSQAPIHPGSATE